MDSGFVTVGLECSVCGIQATDPRQRLPVCRLRYSRGSASLPASADVLSTPLGSRYEALDQLMEAPDDHWIHQASHTPTFCAATLLSIANRSTRPLPVTSFSHFRHRSSGALTTREAKATPPSDIISSALGPPYSDAPTCASPTIAPTTCTTRSSASAWISERGLGYRVGRRALQTQEVSPPPRAFSALWRLGEGCAACEGERVTSAALTLRCQGVHMKLLWDTASEEARGVVSTVRAADELSDDLFLLLAGTSARPSHRHKPTTRHPTFSSH